MLIRNSSSCSGHKGRSGTLRTQGYVCELAANGAAVSGACVSAILRPR